MKFEAGRQGLGGRSYRVEKEESQAYCLWQHGGAGVVLSAVFPLL